MADLTFPQHIEEKLSLQVKKTYPSILALKKLNHNCIYHNYRDPQRILQKSTKTHPYVEF